MTWPRPRTTMPGTTATGDVEQALDVGVDHLFPVLDFAHVELVEAAAEAGVVDQDVDLGPLGRQIVDGVLHGAMVAHIKVDGVHRGGAALHGLRGDLGEAAGAAGSQQETGSFGGKGKSSGRSDAGAGSGDEDDLSFKAHDPILANCYVGRRDGCYERVWKL